jgi:hypothetical protein
MDNTDESFVILYYNNNNNNNNNNSTNLLKLLAAVGRKTNYSQAMKRIKDIKAYKRIKEQAYKIGPKESERRTRNTLRSHTKKWEMSASERQICWRYCTFKLQ